MLLSLVKVRPYAVILLTWALDIDTLESKYIVPDSDNALIELTANLFVYNESNVDSADPCAIGFPFHKSCKLESVCNDAPMLLASSMRRSFVTRLLKLAVGA